MLCRATPAELSPLVVSVALFSTEMLAPLLILVSPVVAPTLREPEAEPTRPPPPPMLCSTRAGESSPLVEMLRLKPL